MMHNYAQRCFFSKIDTVSHTVDRGVPGCDLHARVRKHEMDLPQDAPKPEMVLDLRGLNCPIPVLRAKKALRTVPIGGTLVLECTDPLTVTDVPHFVNQTGHALETQERRG